MKQTIGMGVVMATLVLVSNSANALTEAGETSVLASVKFSEHFGSVTCESTNNTYTTTKADPMPYAIVTCTSGSTSAVKLYVESGNNPGAEGNTSFMINTNGDHLDYNLEKGVGPGSSFIQFTSFIGESGSVGTSEEAHGVDIPAKGSITMSLTPSGSSAGRKPGNYMDYLHVKTFTP